MTFGSGLEYTTKAMHCIGWSVVVGLYKLTTPPIPKALDNNGNDSKLYKESAKPCISSHAHSHSLSS